MDISATDIFNKVVTLEKRCETLTTALREREKRSVDAARFYNVTMTTEDVAKFHGVSAARVRDYADRGLIELHPNSTDARRLFRASTILTLDFDSLKKEKAFLKR